jgi:hypothetical protein
MTKADRLIENRELFEKTVDYYDNEKFGFDVSISERLKENLDFYTGVGQWPEDVKQELRSKYKPALVINRVAPAINQVSGYERQNRTEIKPFAFETSDSNQAFVMEYVLKHVHRSFDSAFNNSQGFLKGIVTSEAHWEYSIDIGDDGLPEIARELLPTGSVKWDPLSKRYDHADARFCFQDSWMAEDELLQLRPTLKDKALEYEQKTDGVIMAASDYRWRESRYFYDDFAKKIRLIRLWKKRWEKEYVVIDRSSPTEIRILDQKQIKEIDIENPTFIIRPRMRSRISYNMFSGDEELAYDKVISTSIIPIISFYCFYIEGVYFSLVDLAKDRQRQVNKADSVMSDYLSKLPKLSVMAEERAFKSPEDARRFNGADVGDSMVFSDGALSNGSVQFPSIPGLNIISYYTQLKESMKIEMKEIMGVSDTMQGIKPKGAQSGVAFDILRQQGLTVTEPIYDNYNATKRMMGKLEIELIQKHYPPEKIERIMGGLANMYRDEKLQKIWEQTRDDEEARRKLVDVLMTTKYDCMMDEGFNTTTIRQANQMQFNQLMQAGFPVPPDLIIEHSDISQDQKDQWKAFIQQQQQMKIEGVQ